MWGARRCLAEADAGWTTYPTFETGSPGEFKQKKVRYFNVHEEEDQLDGGRFARWVKRTSQLPGERM